MFQGYALLGDDIVIADPNVSMFYKAAMSMLGVSVSPLKPFESHSGYCEFARQFWAKGCRINLSPVSMKLVLGCHNPKGLSALKVSRPQLGINQLLSIHGLGYKAKARICSGKHSKRITRLFAMLSRFDLPLDLWLGCPSPYVLDFMVDCVFTKSKPSDFKIVPDALIGENPQARYQSLVEITLYRGAMLDYLRYLSEYWRLFNDAYFLGRDPWKVLDELLHLVSVHRDWKEMMNSFDLGWPLGFLI